MRARPRVVVPACRRWKRSRASCRSAMPAATARVLRRVPGDDATSRDSAPPTHHLANLCHNYRGACLHACQYAPPHRVHGQRATRRWRGARHLFRLRLASAGWAACTATGGSRWLAGRWASPCSLCDAAAGARHTRACAAGPRFRTCSRTTRWWACSAGVQVRHVGLGSGVAPLLARPGAGHGLSGEGGDRGPVPTPCCAQKSRDGGHGTAATTGTTGPLARRRVHHLTSTVSCVLRRHLRRRSTTCWASRRPTHGPACRCCWAMVGGVSLASGTLGLWRLQPARHPEQATRRSAPWIAASSPCCSSPR